MTTHADTSSRYGALGLTLALNGAALIALVAWNPNIRREVITYVPFINVHPPETIVPPERAETQPKQASGPRSTATEQLVKTTQPEQEAEIVLPPLPPLELGRGQGQIPGEEPKLEPNAPVLVAARMRTSGEELQPPYPPSLQRLEKEGSVTVRVHVGPDGRPLAIELVRADDPLFFAASRSWGLRHWRFTPATRDGQPVDGWVTLTIRFDLND